MTTPYGISMVPQEEPALPPGVMSGPRHSREAQDRL